MELYCDMELLEADHEPRVYPDDRYSSNTWGPLPPRSYFRFDEDAVASERDSLEMQGQPAVNLQGYTVPRTATGGASLVPSPPWDYVGDFLVIDYWADPDACRRAAAGGHHAARGRRPLRGDLRGLAVRLRGRRRARRPRALAVQGVLHRRQRGARRRGRHHLPVHLGRPGLRARARLDPGLPEEARRGVDDAHLRPRRRRRPGRARRLALRGDVLGARAPDRRGDADPASRSPRPGRSTTTRRWSTSATSRAWPPAATPSRTSTSWSARSAATGRSRRSGRATRRWRCSTRRARSTTCSRRCEVGRGFRFTFAYTIDDLVTVREL